MRDGIHIRNAKWQDYKSLCEIFSQANAEHCQMRPDLYRKVEITIPQSKYRLGIVLRDLFGYQPISLQVAECERRIVGGIFIQSLARSNLSWSAFEKEAYLDNVVVIPNYRRQGIATALLKAAKDWSRETGHTHIWGKIIHQNDPSFALFAKAGFTGDSTNVGYHLT